MQEAQQHVSMMETIEEVYVPSIHVDKSVKVTKAHTQLLQFAGDQNTAARAREAQKAKANALSSSDRLAGLVPVVADWHAKVKLLEVQVQD